MDSSAQDSSVLTEFFNGQVVFVTGGTGFLGKTIIEKLLRVCPGVEKLCLLVRHKKDKSPEERLDAIFNSAIFDIMKEKQPDFKSKVRLVSGDCTLPHLGLSDTDREFLTSSVTCVIHAAATVRFDEPLRIATYINVRATRDIIALAKSMGKLKAMVYVSTAYAHCPRKEIKEEFYDVHISGDNLLNLVECFPDDVLAEMTPAILKDWPNTYVFSKAVAEEVVQTKAGGLPIAVVRPGMVTSVAAEPVPGWVDNIYGPLGVVLGSALGGIRVLRARPDASAELVPVDFVICAVLAAAWNVAQEKTELKDSKKITIYNYINSTQNLITWGTLYKMLREVGFKYFSLHCQWYPTLIFVPNWLASKILAFLLHTLPAHLADAGLILFRKKPIVVDIYTRKINKFLNVISYFAMRHWEFTNDNVQSLWDKMGKKDKELFQFNIGALKWKEYLDESTKGGRIYLLKDPLTTLEAGQRKRRVLTTIHYALMAILLYFAFKLVGFVLRLLFDH